MPNILTYTYQTFLSFFSQGLTQLIAEGHSL
jgi:hypothetical protein